MTFPNTESLLHIKDDYYPMKNILQKCSSFVVNIATNKLMITALLSTSAIFAYAQPSTPGLYPVDLSSATVTKNEIALLQVLSEICPPMLNSQQRTNFYKTYNNELKEMLPMIDNPKAAIQYLSTQQDYKEILSSTRQWTMSFPYEDNLALCVGMADSQN